MQKKRRRSIPLHFMVSEEELALIHERMAEAGIINRSAFIRRMVLKGYVLHVDLTPVKELISLQRRCFNNIRQIEAQTDCEEIRELRKRYEDLWEPLSDLLRRLAGVVGL